MVSCLLELLLTVLRRCIEFKLEAPTFNQMKHVFFYSDDLNGLVSR
jgi:hypothetical protein